MVEIISRTHYKVQQGILYILYAKNVRPLSLPCVWVPLYSERHIIVECDVSRFDITEELTEVSSIQRSFASVELCERMMSRV